MSALPNEPLPGWSAFLDEVPREQLEQTRDTVDGWGEGEVPAAVEERRQALHDPALDVVMLLLDDAPSTTTSVPAAPPK